MASDGNELKIKITAEAAQAIRGTKEYEQALKEMGRSVEATGQKAGQFNRVTNDTTKANKGLIDAFGDLGQRGSAAQDVVEGLGRAANGGAGSLFGLAKATQNFLQIVRGGVAASGPIGLLVTALGVAAGLFLTFKDRIFGAKEELDKTGKSADAFKGKLAELETASKKSLEAQLEQVKKLATGYTELLGLMDEAQGRAKQLNESRSNLIRAQFDRDEQAALAKARTPEERERITADFARRRTSFEAQRKQDALTEDELFARQRIASAQSAIGGAFQQREAARAEVDAALRRSQGSTDIAGVTAREARTAIGVLGRNDVNDPVLLSRMATAKEANEVARLDAAALKAAQDRLAKTEAELAAITAKADAELRKFAGTIENIGVQRQAVAVQAEASGLKLTNEARPKIDELTKTSRAAVESGDFTGQDKANAKIQQIERNVKASTAALQGAAAAVESHAAASTQFAIRVKKTVEKTERQLRNSRD